VVVPHAALKIRTDEQAASIGEPDHTGHALSKVTPDVLMVSHMRRVRAIISGRVQGVGYRAATATEARRLGIFGWVSNRSDGGVELEAEGPDDKVTALLGWCEYGPPQAQVTKVKVEELAASNTDREFKIL
jgi:acylphosphatase